MSSARAAAVGMRSIWPMSTRASASRALVGAARNVHSMRSSWPGRLAVSPDPSRPSASQIIREMEKSKGGGEEMPREGPGAGAERAALGTAVERSDPRTHSRHLPEGVFPSAASGAAPVQRAGAARPGARPTVMTTGASGAMPKTSNWHPPGWDEFAAQSKLPTSARKPLEKPAQEPHNVEVMGMRVVGFLILCVIVIECKDLTWGPAGITKKKNIQRQPEQEAPQSPQ